MPFSDIEWSGVPEAVREAAEANRVGASIADTSRVLAANDHYLEIVGYSRAELHAGEVSWLRLTPPEWLSADARAIGELRVRQRAAPYEKEFVRRDGTRVHVRIGTLLLNLDPLRVLAVTATDGDEVAQALVDALSD